MSNDRPKRKEMLPLAGPQAKFIVIVCLAMILTAVIVSGLEAYFFLTSLRNHDALNTSLAKEIIPLSIMIGAVTLLVLLPLFFLAAVWISHRILGPLRRLAKDLQAVGQGQIDKPFVLRNGDELRFLAEAMAEMKQNLAQRVNACRDAQTQLDQALGRMNSADAAVADAAQASAAMRAVVEHFKT